MSSAKDYPEKSWIPAYIALGIAWGCSFIFIKQGLHFLTPFGVAFVRCALGAATLQIIVRIRGQGLPREKSTWFKLWIVALLLNVFPGVLFAYAEVKVTSILAGIINAATPLTTLIIILLLFRDEKPKNYQLVGLLFGGIGVATVLGIWNGIGHNSLVGVFALLAAVTCYGFSFPFTRKYVLPLGLRPDVLATTQITLASATLLPLFIYNGISHDQFHPIPLLSMLALGAIGTGVAYIWNFQIITAAGSSIASSVTYLTPLVAVIVGVIFLGEGITWNEPVGAALVVLGAAISQGRLTRRK
jgi:drug/metabolite transporter (DMT)-like permease